MARVREMQGTPAQIVTLKSDGKRRHPSHCIFAEGKGANRKCSNAISPMNNEHCNSAKRCEYYEERE